LTALDRFYHQMGLDPDELARACGLTVQRLMELLRELDEPTEAEQAQIEAGCQAEYGVTPLTLEPIPAGRGEPQPEHGVVAGAHATPTLATRSPHVP